MGDLENIATLGNPIPTYSTVEGGANKLGQHLADRATASNEQIQGEMNEGIGTRAGTAVQSDDQLKQQASNQGVDQGMLQAIRNKFNQTAGKSVTGIVNRNVINSPMHRASLLDLAGKATMAQGQVEAQNYEAAMNAQMQMDQARAGILSGIISAAGTGIGAYAGSRQRAPRRQTSRAGMNDFAGGAMDEGGLDMFNGGMPA